MIGSFQTGISGLQQFQQDIEVIGNNIANVDTVGYKSSHMEFADAFSQSLLGGANTMQVGTGVSAAAINSDYTQGTFVTTGNTTDLAVSGNGFFVVKNPASGMTFVTRDGQFTQDSSGYLVTNSGMRLQGYTGAPPYSSASPIGDIQIDAASAITALNDTTVPAPTDPPSFSIDTGGQVNARLSDGVSGVMAQVVLQSFLNPQALMKQSSNLYTYSNTAGPLAAPSAPNTGNLGLVLSGKVEGSNVDLSTEMASLITAQRAFEANGKVITSSDEVIQTLINMKR